MANGGYDEYDPGPGPYWSYPPFAISRDSD